jgi:hypothetical protein
MKANREADWFGETAPTVRLTPHPTTGLGF